MLHEGYGICEGGQLGHAERLEGLLLELQDAFALAEEVLRLSLVPLEEERGQVPGGLLEEGEQLRVLPRRCDRLGQLPEEGGIGLLALGVFDIVGSEPPLLGDHLVGRGEEIHVLNSCGIRCRERGDATLVPLEPDAGSAVPGEELGGQDLVGLDHLLAAVGLVRDAGPDVIHGGTEIELDSDECKVG